MDADTPAALSECCVLTKQIAVDAWVHRNGRDVPEEFSPLTVTFLDETKQRSYSINRCVFCGRRL
jgi:hypothetical protein